MDWIVCLFCSFPLWGVVFIYFLADWLKMRRYAAFLRSDHFLFVKTKDGDLVRKGQSSRNWLALIFMGALQLVFLVIIYQSLQTDPISWSWIVIVSLVAAFVSWLMSYFIRLVRVSPIYFDAQQKEIRFKDGDVEHCIPFADIERIAVNHAGPGADDTVKAPRNTFTIAIALKHPKKSLELARITGRSLQNTTRSKEKLVELIDSVVRVAAEGTVPLQAQLPEAAIQASKPVESLIVQNLHKIQKVGGAKNSVIFSADQEANYFIQLAGAKGEITLYAEAASNHVIPEAYQLSRQQENLIEALGWQRPNDEAINYHRSWQANSHEERLVISQVIMQTFVDGYGFEAGQPLKIDVSLE